MAEWWWNDDELMSNLMINLMVYLIHSLGNSWLISAELDSLLGPVTVHWCVRDGELVALVKWWLRITVNHMGFPRESTMGMVVSPKLAESNQLGTNSLHFLREETWGFWGLPNDHNLATDVWGVPPFEGTPSWIWLEWFSVCSSSLYWNR